MASPVDQVRYEPPPAKYAALETVVVTLLIPLLGLLVHHEDPLFIRAEFPWLILGPLLCGMRYGFIYGFFSAVGVSLMLTMNWRLNPGAVHDFPYGYALAAAITGMLAGEFADGWMRRLGRMQIVLDYTVSRQKEFTRSYHLLKVSHDQLEERLAGHQFSLRSALMDLQKRFGSAVAAEQSPLAGSAEAILEFLSIHGDLARAALYEVSDNDRLGLTPLARLGGASPAVDASHPMVAAALESGNLVSVRDEAFRDPERHAQNEVLAAMPLIDIDNRVWGVITVADMPFLSFHDDNLDMLAALGGAIGDLLTASTEQFEYSGDRRRSLFQLKLRRWIDYSKRYHLQSTVVGLRFSPSLSSNDGGAGLDKTVFGQMRALDDGVVLKNQSGGNSIIMLMPLTDAEGFSGYVRRIHSMLEESLGRRVTESDLKVFDHSLSGKDQVGSVLGLLHQECDVAFA